MTAKKGGLGRNLDSLIPTPIKLSGTSQPIADRGEVPLSSISPKKNNHVPSLIATHLMNLQHQLKKLGFFNPR